MKGYSDIWYESPDGLTLYARDYNPQQGSAIPILCMHGLSRNSADFEMLAEVLAQQHRVICVDQRGRGLSQWDSDLSRYTPAVYVQDMWRLLEHLGIDRVIAIGTSMGGLMGMIMAAERPQKIAGLILNDVGPEVASAGLQRIIGYVGKGQPVLCWDDAVVETRRLNLACFPQYEHSDWQAMAHRIYRENAQGVPVLAYDPAIAKAVAETDSNLVPPDLWPLFQLLAEVPMLTLRGSLSDLLSADAFTKMQQQNPRMLAVEIAGVGHAPALDEPAAQQAIIEFIEQLHSRQGVS